MVSKVYFHIVDNGQKESAKDAVDYGNTAFKSSEEASLPEIIDNIVHVKNIAILRPNKVFRPPTDIYETGNSYIVKLEVAGVSPQQITIEWTGEDLVVRGTRKESTTKKTTHYHQVEINYGEFEQIVRLPSRINIESSKASYEDGFLVITIPKTSNPRTRTVPVENR